MQTIHLKDLLEAGCHFGHQVNRWHPKAKPYIFQSRDGIHIIDLVKTKEGLEKAIQFVFTVGKSRGTLLFVATKRQAKAIVTEEAKRVGTSYLTHRWMGGFFTNWDEVKKNIEKVNQMQKSRDTGAWEQFPKHEQVKLAKTLKKLEGFYSGVSTLTELPQAIFIIDIKREKAAVSEAIKRAIPIVAIVDTNCDPTDITHPIPANDDAVGSITFITKAVAQAYLEGREQGEKDFEQEKKEAEKKRAEEAKKAEKKEEKKEESDRKKEEKPVVKKKAVKRKG